MASEQPNEIPSDHSVTFVFREFKQTLIHQWFMSIGSKNEFHCSMSTVPWTEFYRNGIELLYLWLRDGWPQPIPSAEWDHEKKHVELFADDLFLCPDCGNFYVLEQEGLVGKRVFALIQHPKKDFGSPHWMGLDPSDARRLREFAASRLNVPEFYKQPHKSQSCQQIKLRVIRKFKSESRRLKHQLSSETRAFVEAKPKPALSYASLVSRGLQTRSAPVPAARQKVAHGETVGSSCNKISSPGRGGRKSTMELLSPHPGLDSFLYLIPTVSPWAIFLRHSVAGNPRIPI